MLVGLRIFQVKKSGEPNIRCESGRFNTNAVLVKCHVAHPV